MNRADGVSIEVTMGIGMAMTTIERCVFHTHLTFVARIIKRCLGDMGWDDIRLQFVGDQPTHATKQRAEAETTRSTTHESSSWSACGQLHVVDDRFGFSC